MGNRNRPPHQDLLPRVPPTPRNGHLVKDRLLRIRSTQINQRPPTRPRQPSTCRQKSKNLGPSTPTPSSGRLRNQQVNRNMHMYISPVATTSATQTYANCSLPSRYNSLGYWISNS